jgi:monoamine oxidase
VFQIGLLTDPGAGDIGWSRVPLAELHADHARDVLDGAGVDIRTSAPVERIEVGRGRVVVTTAGEAVEAGAAVVAVAHEAAAGLLDGTVAAAESWHSLGSSPIVNIHLVYDRRVIDEEIVAAVDSPLQFVFDRSASSGLETDGGDDGPQCLAMSISAATRWLTTPADELVAMAGSEMSRLFPAAAGAKVVDSVVIRERSATFAGRPGTRRLRPGALSGVPRLYLAGAWTDTGWPATMEGAVRSGIAAARAVISDQRTAVGSDPEEVLA